MRVNVAIPERHVTAPILNAALEGVTRLNEQLIRSGAVPPWDAVKGTVRWKPEPPGQEHFDHAGLVVKRMAGDCDDLAPYKAASLRVTGQDPDAVAVVKRSGEKRWHAIVPGHPDPSREAGMPGPGARFGVRGATLPVMAERLHGVGGTFEATPNLALRPITNRRGQIEAWQARTDLPWHWQPGSSPADVAMASLHASPVSSQAIVGSVLGAYRLGVCSGFADDYHLTRMQAIADACDGASWEELAGIYGEDHATAAGHVVGSFFGKLWKGVKKIGKKALKIAPSGLSLVPGVGPVAKFALSAAAPALKHSLSRGRHKPPSKRRRRVPSGSPFAAMRAAQARSRAVPGAAYPRPSAGMPQRPGVLWYPVPWC